MAEILTVIQVLAVGAAIWLVPKYIEKRVTEAARGAVDLAVGKALAEHDQALAKERDKYSRDYSLFAEKRNEIYAATFALLEQAKGGFAPFFAGGISSRPDFSRVSERDAKKYVAELEFVSEQERHDLAERIETDLIAARKELDKVCERAALRRASQRFVEFKNTVVINSLYFDEHVEEAVWEVIRKLASVYAYADEIIKNDDEEISYKDRISAFAEVERTTANLRLLMRSEMRAGFTSVGQFD